MFILLLSLVSLFIVFTNAQTTGFINVIVFSDSSCTQLTNSYSSYVGSCLQVGGYTSYNGVSWLSQQVSFGASPYNVITQTFYSDNNCQNAIGSISNGVSTSGTPTCSLYSIPGEYYLGYATVSATQNPYGANPGNANSVAWYPTTGVMFY